jgi:MFS family permease
MTGRLLSWARSNRLALVIFLSMAFVYFFSHFHRAGIGTVFNEIQREFGISASAVAALAAILLYLYAGMQVFIGAGADRFGPPKMILVGGALLAAGGILFPLSKSLAMLYVSRALIGLGASFMYITIVKEIVLIFPPRHFAPLLGVLLVVGYSGGLAAQTPLQRLVASAGWRTAFLVAGVACAAVYVFLAVLLAASGRTRQKHAPVSLGDVRALARTRSAYPLFVCGPINFALYYVIQTLIGQKFLKDYSGMSAERSADVTSLMFLTVVVGSFASGFLPRFAGNRRRPFVVVTGIVVLVACCGLAVGVSAGAPPSWFVACYVLLGLTNATALVGTTLLKELAPPSTAAFAIGVLNAVTYAVVAVVSNAVGLVLDAFADAPAGAAKAVIYPAAAYQMLWLVMAACAVVSVAASLYVPETLGVQREAAAPAA